MLSIETSQKVLSVALFENSNLLTEKYYLESNSHDRLLAPYAQQLISTHLKNDYSKLNYVALSAGPGSFMGLRIGAAFAKGLCYDTDIKLIAVPTLSAIAHEAKNHLKTYHNSIIAVLSSHKELYYYQIFNRKAEPMSDINFDSLENIIANEIENALICGVLPDTEKNNQYLNIQPSSIIVANLAHKMLEQSDFADLDKFEPIYVSDFVPKTSTKKLNI